MTLLNANNISKRKLFLKIVQLEFYRSRGSYWRDVIWAYLSINTIKDAILVGGIAKLTLFQNLPLWTLFFAVFIAGAVWEVVKIIIGWLDFKYGLWGLKAEWEQKNKTLSPFNQQVEKTLVSICEKLEIKHHFKDLTG